MQHSPLGLGNGKPLYLQLAEIIKANIANNTWQQGMMIPSETELAKSYEVSVGTVKKTLDVLSQEGFVIRHQGKGTFVAGPNFSKSFMRFFRFSEDEQTAFSELGSKTLTKEIISASAEVAKALEINTGDKVFHLYRTRSFHAVDFVVEDIYLPYAQFDGIENIKLSDTLLYPIYSQHFNLPVVWADEYLQPAIADKQVAKVLKINEQTPVICIERIAYSSRDVPIEYRRTIGRGDEFKYHIVIR